MIAWWECGKVNTRKTGPSECSSDCGGLVHSVVASTTMVSINIYFESPTPIDTEVNIIRKSSTSRKVDFWVGSILYNVNYNEISYEDCFLMLLIVWIYKSWRLGDTPLMLDIWKRPTKYSKNIIHIKMRSFVVFDIYTKPCMSVLYCYIQVMQKLYKRHPNRARHIFNHTINCYSLGFPVCLFRFIYIFWLFLSWKPQDSF